MRTPRREASVTSVAPGAPPAVSVDYRPRTQRAGRACAQLAQPDGHAVLGRGAQAAARPHRAVHPRHPAGALAADLRRDVQQDPCHPDPERNLRISPTSRRGSWPSRPCSCPIFYGIQIIWERDAGVLAKLMVTPTPRSALITGKAFAAGVRSIVQAAVVVVLSAILGVALTSNPLEAAGHRGRGGAGLGVLLLPVHVDRGPGPEPGPADGHRAGDHHAAVLQLQRAVPDRPDAAAGCRRSARSTRCPTRWTRCAGCSSGCRPTSRWT